jgi:hypothetical protein
MSIMKSRVLSIASIPEELWLNSTLKLPESLVNTYRLELSGLGLMEKAIKGTDKKDIHGGVSDADTLEHFSFRFAVSAGRTEFATISPDDCLAEVSDALVSAFSEGHVALLDIPCGSGSCLGSILTTVLTLRYKKVLPTLPLTISVMAGDTSPKALEIYKSMIARLEPLLDKQAIVVNLLVEQWDATRSDETARLVDHWFAMAAGAEEYVVCISNFNGALIGAGLLDAFTPCLEQILGRLYDKKSTMLWIEPPASSAKNKLFPLLAVFLRKRIPWFSFTTSTDEPISAIYKTRNPLNDHVHDSGVQVQRFNRT